MPKGKVVDISEREVAPDYFANPEFVGQAFAFYCKGLSLAKVAKVMKPEWPAVCERTVQKIAKENGWEQSRANFLLLSQKAVQTAEGLLPNIIMQLENLRVKMEARSSIKSHDVFAYNQLCETLLWITGKHPKFKDDSTIALTNDKYVKAFVDAIQTHRVLGPLLKKFRTEIRERVDEIIARGELMEKRASSRTDWVGRAKRGTSKMARVANRLGMQAR